MKIKNDRDAEVRFPVKINAERKKNGEGFNIEALPVLFAAQ